MLKNLPINLRCSLELSNDSAGLIGAPCITFSRCASGFCQMGLRQKSIQWSSWGCQPHQKSFRTSLLTSRYGLREGFKNISLKQLHDAATKFMDVTSVNVHENVPQFEQVGVPTVISYLSQSYLSQSYVRYQGFAPQNCLGGILDLEPQEARDSVSDV